MKKLRRLIFTAGFAFIVVAGNVAGSADGGRVGTVSSEENDKALTDEAYANLKQEVVRAPSVLSRSQVLLRQLESKQLAELIQSMGLSHHSFLYPVRIRGEKLTSVLGRDLRKLSLMAVWNEKLVPIPFQFDEYDSKSGYVYIEGVNPFPIEGKEHFLDGRDELSFMYRDGGQARYVANQHALDVGKVELELAFKDILGRKRYAYLVSGVSERSELDYVETPLDQARMMTSFYSMAYDPKNFLVIKDYRPHVGQASDERVVDMIYFKMSANVFSRLFKVSMNSHDNIRVKVLGAKDGPVRSVLFLKISVLLAGIPVFSMFSEVNIYEQGIIMPNRAEVGKGALFARIFKDPEIIIFLDMHGLQGGRVSADSFADETGRLRYGLIDGKMDAIEEESNKLQKPGEWIWLNSGLGWDVFMTLSFPEDKFEGMSTSLYYLDDINYETKGESFPGAEPRLGMRLTGLPKNIRKLENLDLEYAFWYPDTLGKIGPRGFYKHLSNPPQLSVNRVSTEP
jgi:hypothetical protein